MYRIVSHETEGLTKITSGQPLKSVGTFIESEFGGTGEYSIYTTMGGFLNYDYLTNYVDSEYSNMIEDSTIWYLGTVGNGESYKLAKYTNEFSNTLTSSTTSAKVGLLRYGELMAGQFERYVVKGGNTNTGLTTNYWLLTPYSVSRVYCVETDGIINHYDPYYAYGVRPSINLKSNVQITGGDGTKNNPFTIELN